MKVPEGVFSEANDEEGEEEQTLGIKASSVSVGVANSTRRKFYVTVYWMSTVLPAPQFFSPKKCGH